MALEPAPSTPPLVVIAHDDPGTADSLRHAVEAATGWQVVMADPSPAGLAAALAGGVSVALIGCGALVNLPVDCRTRSSPSATTSARPTSEPPSPPAPVACSAGRTGPPTSSESSNGSRSPVSQLPPPDTPPSSSPPGASRAAPAPPRSRSTWPRRGPAGDPPRSFSWTSPEALPSASTSAPSRPGPTSSRWSAHRSSMTTRSTRWRTSRRSGPAIRGRGRPPNRWCGSAMRRRRQPLDGWTRPPSSAPWRSRGRDCSCCRSRDWPTVSQSHHPSKGGSARARGRQDDLPRGRHRPARHRWAPDRSRPLTGRHAGRGRPLRDRRRPRAPGGHRRLDRVRPRPRHRGCRRHRRPAPGPLAPREVRAALRDRLWSLIPTAAAELAAAAEDGTLLLDRHDLSAVQAMVTLANRVIPFAAVSA